MTDWLVKFSIETATFNSIFGICLYWLPMLICMVGYTMRTARNIQVDKKERAEKESGKSTYYSPTDTIGDLVGRSLISLIPIGNLWAALFDVSPMLFEKLFKWIGQVFDQPLVPKRKEAE